jgi:hypothetical protein
VLLPRYRLLGTTVEAQPAFRSIPGRQARDRDQDAELRRLFELGARPADVGQGEVSWVVLADPEGNEFCLLRGRVDPL